MGEARRRREFRESQVRRHPRGTRLGGQFREKVGGAWEAVASRALMVAPGIVELELAERSEKALKAYEMAHLVAEGLFHVPGVDAENLRIGRGDIPWEQRLSEQMGSRMLTDPFDAFDAQTSVERAADKRRYGHNLGEQIELARGRGTIVRLYNNESGKRVAGIRFEDGVEVDYLIGPAHSPAEWQPDPKTSWATRLMGGLDRALRHAEGY